MSTSRLSDALLKVARARLEDLGARSEANLRRATSDLYYALFHAICEAVVEPLGIDPESESARKVFLAMYRQMDHGTAEQKCRSVARSGDFPQPIAAFAKLFVTLKNRREQADYDPLATFPVSEVMNHLQNAETRIEGFWQADQGQRTTFACFVALRFKDPEKLRS